MTLPQKCGGGVDIDPETGLAEAFCGVITFPFLGDTQDKCWRRKVLLAAPKD